MTTLLPGAARLRAFATLVLLLGVTGCRLDPQGPLDGRASDEWVRSYDLAPNAEFQIVSADGAVVVDGGAGPKVDVRAERIALATTDEGARVLVPRIQIREDISPERIVLQTEGLGGIVIGVKVQVNYHVSLPPKARLRVRTANGPITLTNLDGRVVAASANGEVTARGLRGGVEARVTNSKLTVELAEVGTDPIDLRATNGAIQLSLPSSADANIALNVTNGKIETGDLKYEPLGDATPRRVRGRLNAGGTPIEVNAINGSIRIDAR